VIAAEYNDSKLVHELMTFCYRLAEEHNCAIILCAHPKKEDLEHRISLERDPVVFFETVMGSSHFVNSAGSLWGIQRQDDYSVFLGGRQRAEGHQGAAHIWMDDDGWFRVRDNYEDNLNLVLNTPARATAWSLLPDPPKSFGYREGATLVKSAMRSSSTFQHWMKECRRLCVIIEKDGKLTKATGEKNIEVSDAMQAA